MENISSTGQVTGPLKLVLRHDSYSDRVRVSYQGSLPALVTAGQDAAMAFVQRHGLDRRQWTHNRQSRDRRPSAIAEGIEFAAIARFGAIGRRCPLALVPADHRPST
jgi:hypothetical protein